MTDFNIASSYLLHGFATRNMSKVEVRVQAPTKNHFHEHPKRSKLMQRKGRKRRPKKRKKENRKSFSIFISPWKLEQCRISVEFACWLACLLVCFFPSIAIQASVRKGHEAEHLPTLCDSPHVVCDPTNHERGNGEIYRRYSIVRPKGIHVPGCRVLIGRLPFSHVHAGSL